MFILNMYKTFFRQVKKLVPRISDTELIALKSGNTHIDRQILEGNIKFPQKPFKVNKFPESKLNDLLKNFDIFSKVYPNDNNNYWVEYLAKNGFFSFLIDKAYGGNKLSVNELSNILTKITSLDPGLGVVAMVPNSLGPGELITKYGTTKQKKEYLPKLANGEYIPCFGLTGPNNGSDATGQIDTGVLVYKDNKKYIEIEINKRYITLAPVSNLIGIAFNLDDQYELLDQGKPGVTVALLEKGTPGLEQLTYHNPLNAGFPNGTLKGKILIPVENIIGGEKNAGQGWKMLMECLSAGRGISLPATANASSKVATFGIFNYIKVRKQFKLQLAEMEAIQEKFNRMVFNTWIIQSSVCLTNDILDNGYNPAVISAIMKQQTTERGRDVLNEAMDIHGGAGICIGYNNFLEKFYRSAPIGITVEGSNTLTRSLIIFGQGLNKSHPHIYKVLDSILNNDVDTFKTGFKDIIRHSINLYVRSLLSRRNNLEDQIVNFATLTNFVSLKGGLIKKEQMLSGDMADIFSNLYLALSVQYYDKENKASPILTDYIIKKLVNENQIKINKVIDNLGFQKFLLLHIRNNVDSENYENEKRVFNEIMSNKKIIEEIKKNIHIKDNILADLEKINEEGLETENPELFNKLKNKIINVDEYII
tara:strand:+ start:4274 stop:6220 length:1947 start_codon:yes stop_codon:yes gene_type:complete